MRKCCSDQDGEPAQKMVGQMVQENIRKAPTPYLGLDNFEVSVAPQLSTDKRQINETVYDPEARRALGPQCPREGDVAERGSFVADDGAAESPRSAGQRRRHQEFQRGEAAPRGRHPLRGVVQDDDDGQRRLCGQEVSIAVLINRARLVADLGDKTNQAIIDSKIAEISQLAATAGGLDRAARRPDPGHGRRLRRGSRELAPVPPIGFVEMLNRQMGSFINAATILAVAAMLVWFGLRSAVNGILTHRAQQEQAEAVEAAAQLEAAALALPEQEDGELNLVEDLEGKMQRTPQKRLEQIVRLDQTQAAAILKDWMRREEAA